MADGGRTHGEGARGHAGLGPAEIEWILGRLGAWRRPAWWVGRILGRLGIASDPAPSRPAVAKAGAAGAGAPPGGPPGPPGDEEIAELLATGGRWSALSAWAARRGVALPEAQRRWHRARALRTPGRAGGMR